MCHIEDDAERHHLPACGRAQGRAQPRGAGPESHSASQGRRGEFPGSRGVPAGGLQARVMWRGLGFFRLAHFIAGRRQAARRENRRHLEYLQRISRPPRAVPWAEKRPPAWARCLHQRSDPATKVFDPCRHFPRRRQIRHALEHEGLRQTVTAVQSYAVRSELPEKCALGDELHFAGQRFWSGAPGTRHRNDRKAQSGVGADGGRD